MLVEIDINSGFCPGVTQAVKVAEEILSDGKTLYCLGDIVHNTAEVNRLKEMGLKTINYADFENLNNVSVLIRAHGEPPKTYDIAKKNNIILIDASCPVVLRLQKRIREAVQVGPDDLQVVIFGKKNHAEVNGLVGQAPDKAIVVSNINDLKKLDVRKPIYIFSQTTQSPEKYSEIIDKIKLKAEEILGSSNHIKFLNSICPLMAKREPLIADFATKHDVI
ncbi:MAG: 4-hydroxy-3-methylbut-2-enyl diphosphate reductase, partial [Bacteroidales bacterium]|nr:4-hydroxy-3-methylbut-2-enyl diphosphate reductase [Bacteroidales bacterium]